MIRDAGERRVVLEGALGAVEGVGDVRGRRPGELPAPGRGGADHHGEHQIRTCRAGRIGRPGIERPEPHERLGAGATLAQHFDLRGDRADRHGLAEGGVRGDESEVVAVDLGDRGAEAVAIVAPPNA